MYFTKKYFEWNCMPVFFIIIYVHIPAADLNILEINY